MSRSLKDGQYVGIDDSKFGDPRGVTTARDTQAGTTVMIKWFQIRSREQLEEAKEEADNLKSFDHPNIVKFFDYLGNVRPAWWEFGPLSFIVMEYCDGGSLSDWIGDMERKNKLPTRDEVFHISSQIVAGLRYCHMQNKVHLDIKPANIFLKSNGMVVKIGDFGSASAVKSVVKTSTSTNAAHVKNTELYAPPELFTEFGIAKSAALDIWGFGLVLQELITLKHAFYPVNDPLLNLSNQIKSNIRDGKRTKIFDFREDFAEFTDFEDLLKKCLSSEKRDRPRNAIELASENIFQHVFATDENTEDKTVSEKFIELEKKLEREKIENRSLETSNRMLNEENSRLNDELEKLRKKYQKTDLQNTKFFKLKVDYDEIKEQNRKLKRENEKLLAKLSQATSSRSTVALSTPSVVVQPQQRRVVTTRRVTSRVIRKPSSSSSRPNSSSNTYTV
ncbi:Oidioi.mRNA.OKI2018_I69.chr1.g2578.t1.cds [Oikopleura dioica]|uniref:Oidioi.mRNA.OKI2018_I69.chr1.g2578.t1.cds n=1 Tax=Oikopleura dioica TaxID=34765 RepID=A0ABN7SRI5_OIKDI|nr:Oidioi.mRNA.OKI2018_I69.chr1.g2578.t1.cds [Oikopleura dioica]